MILFLIILVYQNSDFTPPGTVKIGDIFIDKTEILVIHWLEYEWWQKGELDNSEYKKLVPDSSMTWYRHPDSRYLPMTYISKKQAEEFCLWRSGVVSEKLGIEIRYRLPTPQEWKEVSQMVFYNNKKWIEKSITKINKSIAKYPSDFLYDSRSQPKRDLEDMFWNISEMTSESGVAMGSNNSSIIKSSELFNVIPYDQPASFLGFRCVAEIITE